MINVELPINPPEPVEVGYCVYCGGEIYEGDEVSVISRSFGSKTEYVHGGDDYECKRDYAYSVTYEESGVIDRNKNIS